MDNSFIKAPLQVPKLSGFDKSHQNLLTTKVGTITPILVDELIPGSKVNLRLALSGSLPPLASETFMRCSIKTEAFFVPMRLLSGSFENFFTDSPKRYFDGTDPLDAKAALPRIIASNATAAQSIASMMGNGSLADYLGFRSGGATVAFVQGFDGISLMPFLAYHKIYSDWYRNSLVQRDVFLPRPDNNGVTPSGTSVSVACCPYIYSDINEDIGARNFSSLNALTLSDGISVLSLRQRNFGLDYFTTATPQPQQGDPAKVSFDTGGSTGEFSIAALRASNSLQQFKERNNLLGDFYVDHLRGRYGVRPSDAIAQRAILLGSGEFEVYSKGVYQTALPSGSDGTNNPFTGSVGARFGSAYASGSDFLVNFEATEPGYLFVMATLVPRVTYSSGVDSMLVRYTREGSIGQMANPILQNVGPEPIYQYELTGNPNGSIFGYTDRYASFKTKQDTLHGLLRDGQSLQSFALQRTFESGDSLQISSEFLQIPTNYLDQVAAVSGSISQYGCWMDCFFDYKVAMPLSKYSLPSLQDPAYEHGKVVVVNKGGSKL